MDQLLLERVNQLEEIAERLRLMLRAHPDQMHKMINDLRNDLALMIQRAEDEYAEF